PSPAALDGRDAEPFGGPGAASPRWSFTTMTPCFRAGAAFPLSPEALSLAFRSSIWRSRSASTSPWRWVSFSAFASSSRLARLPYMKPRSAPAPAPMIPNGEPKAKPIMVARSTPWFEMGDRVRLPLPPAGAGGEDPEGVDVEAGGLGPLPQGGGSPGGGGSPVGGLLGVSPPGEGWTARGERATTGGGHGGQLRPGRYR